MTALDTFEFEFEFEREREKERESGRVQLITIRLIYSSFAIRLVNENPTGILRVDGSETKFDLIDCE